MSVRPLLVTALACLLVATGARSSQAQEPPALVAARAAWERHPEDVDSIIWYGRRVGYTGAFQEAVDIYTAGLRLHPNEPRCCGTRARYLSLRRFRGDRRLELAARLEGTPDEVEPDGQPNARGIPTSTLHSNIRYHLALAYFVTGDFTRALPIWEEDARVASNIDQRVAATYWWVLTLAHLGRADAARATLAPHRLGRDRERLVPPGAAVDEGGAGRRPSCRRTERAGRQRSGTGSASGTPPDGRARPGRPGSGCWPLVLGQLRPHHAEQGLAG
jgi:hypothetical protein